MKTLCRVVVPFVLLLWLGCGDSNSSSRVCVGEAFANQPAKRLVVGSTYLLPATTCDGVAWRLRAAPAANANEVVVASDGVAQFTPHVPGHYTFELAATGETWELGVIASDGVPFHNLNYYPTRSLALVAGQLWVADVYAPTVSVVDADTMTETTTIATGAWPVAIAWTDGMDYAVVAQRAADSLGVVDVASRRIVDSIHVGDEPANVVVSPDGALAYVALQTEGVVAVVDLAARKVVARIDAGRDLLGLAITPAGDKLFVASHRSGQPSRFPYQDDPVSEERDITVIDTATREVVDTYMDAGTTIEALHVSADGNTLYAALAHNDTQASFLDPDQPNFTHEIAVYDIATGTRRQLVNVSRQDSSGGPVSFLHGMAETADTLWVAAEGVDQLVGLSLDDFHETHRVSAPGRPRRVIAAGGRLFVHGAQALRVTAYDSDGAELAHVDVGRDPRSAALAAGQAYFTGAGEGYGADWSCNGCHADGLSDTLAWRVGPTPLYEVTRPLFWLEGTTRLGWPGYSASAHNFAFEGGSTIGRQASPAQAEVLATYLRSLMPPPAANGFTQRDGSHSEQGLRGEALFEGKGGCITCHPAPLYTSRKLFAEGITPGPSDTPSLIGAYRHNVWLQAGQARTLRDAVVAASDWIEVDLSDDEIDDITRYVSELTGRDFFAIGSTPARKDDRAAVDRPIELSFSAPVFDDATNLAGITLVDAAGNQVPASVTASGRHVTITPDAVLPYDSAFSVRIAPTVEAFDERHAVAQTIEFSTATAPTATLDGNYTWTIHMPAFDPQTGEFDFENTIPINVDVTAMATAAGADVRLTYREGLYWDATMVISGDQLELSGLPVPVRDSFAETLDMTGTASDSDGDGSVDTITGSFTLSAPGIALEGVQFDVARPALGCDEGSSGSVGVSVSRDDDAVSIAWTGDDGLALYVTDPGVNLPMGPDQPITGGATYWAIAAEAFPTGFVSPVTYGQIPDAAVDDGATHGAVFEQLQDGKCYSFSVVTTSFAVGTYTLRWSSTAAISTR